MTVAHAGHHPASLPGTMLLTPEQAAAELQIARRRVFVLISDGILPSIKIGKSRRISRAALAAYVASLENGVQQ
jgi:excisionase family DNA binding protein